VHLLTFSPIIPQDFKLLFVDCVEIIWVTILSAAVNKDAEKALRVPIGGDAERPATPAVQLIDQLDMAGPTALTMCTVPVLATPSTMYV
jgi:protein Mpv17